MSDDYLLWRNRLENSGVERDCERINAAAHALFWYLSWFFPPVFLTTLVDSEKRCLHDLLAGIVIVRRL